MTIYPINSILRLADGEDIFPPVCLEDFSKEYARAVSEDKDAPLFSKTSKYSTFPVRCPWKNGPSYGKGDSDLKSLAGAGGFVFPKKTGKGKRKSPGCRSYFGYHSRLEARGRPFSGCTYQDSQSQRSTRSYHSCFEQNHGRQFWSSNSGPSGSTSRINRSPCGKNRSRIDFGKSLVRQIFLQTLCFFVSNTLG